MLDWLKPILGDGYNEEIDNKIAAEINKGFVTKADYDAAKDAQRTAAEALADANKALAEYKDTDIDGLRKSAEEWQAKAEQAEKDADARVAAVQFDAKLDSAIAAAHGRSGKAIRALLDLDALRGSEDPDKDISLYINSPGGSVSAGLAIYDTMQYIRPNVSTICLGMAASMGAVLLTAGADGKRLALPNAKIMIHQPMGGMQGQASDIEIHAKEILKTREKLNEILAKHTRQPLDKIEADTDRDYYMSAEEALKYGIVDKIIEKR